ncbi:ParB-like nuclease domain-containing protein [Methylobacterium phyllostachyos]|uniref:ParB-like nuclease domain-containing protein n=1 Tax=Methylobacterium phyllostachyos TaxID=582672 RepID=A0A1G9S7A9_9HYPH|nr:ParB-like nuclease domain-containing protein [Methylobacterium phyllostachyos]
MRTDHRLRYAAVEIVGVRTLTGFDRNARTHSPEQVAQLAAAIDRFGFTQPLLVDERDVIIAGHGRLAAAKSLGMQDVPVIRVTGLTDAERGALVLADNRIALNAGWDEKLLAEELRSLQDAIGTGDLDLGDAGLEALGFGEAELREYEELLAPPPEKEPVREVMLGEEPHVWRTAPPPWRWSGPSSGGAGRKRPSSRNPRPSFTPPGSARTRSTSPPAMPSPAAAPRRPSPSATKKPTGSIEPWRATSPTSPPR